MTTSDVPSTPALSAAELLKILDGDAVRAAASESLADAVHELRAARYDVREEGGCLVLDPAEGDLLPAYVAAFQSRPIRVFRREVTGSTNLDAKKAAETGETGPAVFLAETQENGKGRAGRVWVSGRGQAVEMSLLLRPAAAAERASGLSLAVGLGVQEAVEEMTGVRAEIKWPNDIVAAGKKLAGILVETSVLDGRLEYLVAGIGINANQISFPEPVADRAVSLRQLTGKPVLRARLCASVAEHVLNCVERFLVRGPSSVLKEYGEKSAVLGREVTVYTPRGEETGRCVGFGAGGELRLKADGEVREYTANEVSVRGRQSYV